MRLILILLGVFWIIAGVLLVVLTEAFVDALRKIFKLKNVKAFGIISLLFGIIFIKGASLVSIGWVAVLLGLLSFAKGIFFLFGPEKKIKSVIDWWLNASKKIYKSWGVVVFLLGVLLLLML